MAGASRSVVMAAAGVSIITPSRGVAPPVSATATSSMARACRTSATEAIIGSITATAPLDRTRQIARSWVSRMSGRCRPDRTPRRPSAGFSSGGVGR